MPGSAVRDWQTPAFSQTGWGNPFSKKVMRCASGCVFCWLISVCTECRGGIVNQEAKAGFATAICSSPFSFCHRKQRSNAKKQPLPRLMLLCHNLSLWSDPNGSHRSSGLWWQGMVQFIGAHRLDF